MDPLWKVILIFTSQLNTIILIIEKYTENQFIKGINNSIST